MAEYESSTAEPHGNLGLVLTGGGARGAYQVGILSGIGRLWPELQVPVLTGISAGGINATFLAAHPGNLGEATAALRQLWLGLSPGDVFRVDLRSLGLSFARWGLRLASGGSYRAPRARGLVDTQPLRELLSRELGPSEQPIPGIAHNLAQGKLDALALATVNYGTGQTVSWYQGKDILPWRRPDRRSKDVPITVEHVMASASLPFLFPAVRLGQGWYGDGGVRMAAPLSPALHLGAGRLLAISTRYGRSASEADSSAIAGYPPPAQIAGNLVNAIFLDVLDRDVRRLVRLNGLLQQLEPEQRQGLRPVEVLLLRPSQDLGRLASRYEPRLPKGLRFLTRGLGTRETSSPDFLSLLMFQEDYVRQLIEIGERDVEAQQDSIAKVLEA